MRRVWIVVIVASVLLAPGVAEAQNRGLFSASILGGVAGAFDAQGDRSFDHSAIQLGLGMMTDERIWTVVKAGRLDLDDQELAIGRLDTEIEFLQVAGEIHFDNLLYDLGISLGVGLYRLDARTVSNQSLEEEAVGLALGWTGDFELTRRLSVVAEIDVHYVFFRDTNFYGAALAGVAVHF